MNVAREVILDLLPLYLAGEASPASRALVEEHLQHDADLAERIRVLQAEGFAPTASSELSPELELESLRRTRRLLGLQRWLFGLGIMFAALSLSMEFSFHDGRLREFHFLLRDHPLGLGLLLVLSLACWAAYITIRRRLRIAPR
jgi:predicted anti-sigma-YlaC factor YlaD